MKNLSNRIDWQRVDTLIRLALEEDLGEAGDTTSKSVVPEDLTVQGRLIARENLVCAGLDVARRVFDAVQELKSWQAFANDGDALQSGTLMAEFTGEARPLLTAERTALNFLQRLCGVATASRDYAAKTRGTGTVILDTRKTTPGWRNLEKYAVSAGGSQNHRFGLYDRIMIKDNHRVLAGFDGPGGILRSVEKAKVAYPDLEVEVEADTLKEVEEALEAKADIILLDNMSNDEMAEAIAITDGRAKLEASGGITLERIPSIAQLGVDFISVGALTHSVKAADISMEISEL